MRRLGLLGGVTWHSTSTYYAGINRGVASRLGPFRSADLVLRSLDYGAVRDARESGDWRPLGTLVVAGCRDLKQAGAEGIVLCSNSLHALVPRVESEVGLPVLHIADALAAALGTHQDVAFFGTGFTMRQPFMRDRLATHNIRAHLPADVDGIDRIILEELACGQVNGASRAFFQAQLAGMDGVTAMVLGCTEIGMLIAPADVPLPVFDTVDAHIEAALNWMGGSGSGHPR